MGHRDSLLGVSNESASYLPMVSGVQAKAPSLSPWYTSMVQTLPKVL